MPIYFAWFTTALLSVGGDADDQNLPQSGRLLYCVRSGFRNTYPNTALLAAISMQIVEGAAAYSQHRTDFPHLQGKRSKAPSKFCSVAL